MTSNTSSAVGGGGSGGGSSSYDPYGTLTSAFWPSTAAPWPSTVATFNYPYGINTGGSTIHWNQPLKADTATLSRAQVSDLAAEMTTRVQPGEKVVICLEYSVTDAQVEELRRVLNDLGIEGVIVRQARATVPPLPMPFSAKEQRVDYLARILDLWEQRPGLLLTDLLAFYGGQSMGDNEFVTAVEAHFRLGLA